MSILIGSARVAIVPDVSDFGADLKAKLAAELRSLGRPVIPVAFSIDSASLAQVRAQASSLAPATLGIKADLDKGSLAAARAEADEYLSNAFDIATVDVKKVNVNLAALDAAAAHLNDTFGIFSEQRAPAFIANSRLLDQMNARLAESFGNVRSQAASAALSDAQLEAAQSGLIGLTGELNAGERVANELAADSIKLQDQKTAAVLASIDATLALARASTALAGGGGGGGAGGGGGGNGGGGLWGAFMGYQLLSGGGWTTKIAGISAWHLALDGAVEALIAVGTAAAAASVGLSALYPTLSDIYDHLNAVRQVNLALGNQIPGLDTQFSSLAKSMAPQGIELYGAALHLVTGQTSVFGSTARTVVTLFDDWAAKIDLWAKGQGTFAALLHTGVGYLTQFAHVAGNVGIALGNLLRDDPGIARFLLDVIDGAAKLLDVFTSLPQPIVYSVLALHGLWLWGRVLGGVFLRAASGAVTFGKALLTIGSEPLAWVAAGAVALGYLAYQAGQADGATKKFIATIDSGLGNASASQAILITTEDLGKLQERINGVNWQGIQNHMDTFHQVTLNAGYAVRKLSDAFFSFDFTNGGITARLKDLGSALGVIALGNNSAFAQQAQNDIRAYNDEINKLLGSQRNLFHETGSLMTQGYSYTEALGLMDLAGVRASDSFALMQQKVANLIAGYQAMSIRGGLLANSVNAVNLSVDIGDSKIQQLTSAWSQFFTLVSGGESGLVAFGQALNTLGAKGGLSAGQLTARSNFLAAAQAAQTEMNNLMSLASAAGLGAKGTTMLTQASKDMIAPMLGAARNSRSLTTILYALAQQGGYRGADAFKALAQWVGNVKDPAKNLDGIVTQLTVDAGNLTQDVKNLSTALGTTLNQAMAQAIFYADGGQKAFDAYATALQRGDIYSAQVKSSATVLASQLLQVTGNTQSAHREFDTMTTAMGYTKAQADKLWQSIQKVATAEASVHNKNITLGITEIASIVGNPAAVRIAQNNGGTIHVGAYAAGTASANAGWAVVGENGPELIRMRGGEQVIPTAGYGGLAGALAGGGGGFGASGLSGGGGQSGDTYIANFDGWTAGSLESRVRTAFYGMSVQQGKQLRIGRRN